MTNNTAVSHHELKEEGNKHYKAGEYDEALACYTKALSLVEGKQDKLIYYKNRAACYLKLDRYQDAANDSTKALDISGADTKALFRRVQALEQLGQLSEAYVDARRLYQIDPKNKAVQDACYRLRNVLEVKVFEQNSTENRVNSMLKILFDSSAEEDNRRKAADNLVYLSKDEPGAERIFREGGPTALTELVDQTDPYVKLSAIRTLSALCNGHQARSLIILREITVDRLCSCLGSINSSEELSLSTFHLIQSIVDALQGEDKREHRGKDTAVRADFAKDLMGILLALKGMLLDKNVSAEGRDNGISLIAKNVPRKELRYGSNARTMKFLEIGGVKNMLEVSSYGFKRESAPYAISPNTRLNCSVALTKLYDDLGGDKARGVWDDQVIEYVQSLFATGTMTGNMQAMSVLTCLLQGPFDCGQKILGLQGVLETMVAMTGAEEEEAQVAAIEAIITSASKQSKATFVVENGATLLKELYKKSKSDAVKIRALVGLCKLGSSHGSDVSMKAFAEGSNVKLAKQCRKYLTNTAKEFDLRKWAAEGLSYLTLDAEAKEELCRDKEALQALFELAKSKDKTVMYGVVSCLVNCTNTYDKNDDVLPEMIELAKYAKHHIPEEDEKDKPEYVRERVKLLVESGMVHALVCLANIDTAVLTDTTKELLCRVFLIAVEDEANRGAVVAAGGGRSLLPLATDGTKKGKCLAAQAIARIAITSNPVIAFPGQRSLECVRVLQQLLHPECNALQNFEAMMALTNLAGIDDTHRRRIIREKMLSYVESFMLEDHEMLRRSATELMCNMCTCKEMVEIMERDGHDRVKLLTLLCAEDDEATRRAAAGALAMLTSRSEKVCKKIRETCKSWLENLSIIALDEVLDIQHRGMVVVHNIVNNCKFSAEEIVASNILEILMVLSKDDDPKKARAKELAITTLKKLEEDKFIQATGL
ncbi:protein unc-45 homolog B-like [Clavelina lepadiformis]|uniref:protein unc-45 homolog B-like n=1 Tax=Clavelina lepadiformis TaxID=159417 RepID=UPI004043908E